MQGDLSRAGMSPAELRAQCRSGAFDRVTSGYALGHMQANMVILPAEDAEDFSRFCELNPKPCPVLEMLAPGDPEPRAVAPGADVRTDLPRYRVFRNGECVDEPTDIGGLWRDDLVTFLLGCSFSAEEALLKAGVALRHLDETGEVPMFRTTIQNEPAGRFHGPMVVTMRPFSAGEADRAAEITGHYPMAHGGPVHRGDPAEIGIEDLTKPTYGPPVSIRPDDSFVYWACGVTPQEVILRSKPDFAITHAPGYMFVCDITSESTRVP